MIPRWDPPGKLTWLKGKAEVAPGSVFHTMVSITVVAIMLLNTYGGGHGWQEDIFPKNDRGEAVKIIGWF